MNDGVNYKRASIRADGHYDGEPVFKTNIMTKKPHAIEWRVREVKRYIVTRYHPGGGIGGSLGSSTHGEFDNFEIGYEVAHALCRAEHERLGFPIDDERISYPDPRTPYGRQSTDEVAENSVSIEAQ